MSPARGVATSLLLAVAAASGVPTAHAADRPAARVAFGVEEGLNLNRFLRDGDAAAHLVLRSGPSPRILVAFPAGNGGVGLWFEPDGPASTWRLERAPAPAHVQDGRGRPLRGITFEASTARPTLRLRRALLTSVRVLRDFEALGRAPAEVDTEPQEPAPATLAWARDRLDGAAGFALTVEVTHGSRRGATLAAGPDGRIGLRVTAATGETPLAGLGAQELLAAADRPGAPAATEASRQTLAFLAYREKLLAGSWRFNTYFGRDTLLSVRLLMPALAPPAIEAGLASVLARLSPDGAVAHEEDVGEFAVLDHLRRDGTRSAAPVYDYKMIDGDFLLAPVLAAWLLDDPRAAPRARGFLAAPVSSDPGAPSRGAALVRQLRRVIELAQPFADAPQPSRLVALHPGVPVGNWRDSEHGLGDGRIPYDVNAVLVPAALDALARLQASGLLDGFASRDEAARFGQARAMADTWRRAAPGLFAVTVPRARAIEAVRQYARALGVPDAAARATIGPAGVTFHALALDGDGRPVPVMNSDEGFALLFGRPDAGTLDAAADLLLRPFPAGLLTPAGMLVANAAFAPTSLQPQFGRTAYHGAVVWSWQQALFAAGLERQRRRRDLPAETRARLAAAERALWTAIDATARLRNSELWSWTCDDGTYRPAAFGAAAGDADESNAAQLWSTVYLGVARPPAAGAAR